MKRNIYMALGDSITVGYEAVQPEKAYISQVSRKIREMALVEQTLVLAQNGWASQHVFSAIRSLHPQVWEQTNILTLYVGGNDLRKRFYSIVGSPTPEQTVDQAMEGIAERMGRLFTFIGKQQLPYKITATVYNPAPQSPLASYAIEKLNGIIRNDAEQHGFDVVDIYKAFNGKEAKLINRYKSGRIEDLFVPFARPIHPNDQGHAVIAELFNNQLRKRVR